MPSFFAASSYIKCLYNKKEEKSISYYYFLHGSSVKLIIGRKRFKPT